MKNKHRYIYDLLEILAYGERFAVIDGKPVSCDLCNCRKCELFGKCASGGRRAWMDAEYEVEHDDEIVHGSDQ